ncbi:glutamyl-tRNA synthetase [Zhouia amylolytica]|uniref:Glutamate--tRNA ligase n=1 Tax=Zhouia amylolytica TaxID=376730 RepID=A0A1I6PRD2_9FLAO|nr:glutamate--tRNA ligase [Zhouia amylolytica]SFS42746.1 glutamyl-tRNA synthetase [Zhouia amylolytica]
MTKKVRVRFAPSPTGPLHIGGVRTALFNYLFAKKHDGDFVLRIEDTDQNRYVEGAEQYIIDALNWCGIPFDEGPGNEGSFGPYRQSERKALYKEYADQLIESGWAYYAFDTSEELDAHRKDHEANGKTFIYNWHNRLKLKNSLALTAEEVKAKIDAGEDYVVRFKSPQDETLHLKDIIRGDIKIDTNLLDDKVLFKSDGMPTYHLANIVDDHLMEISHVIRGEEWLPSLALHVLLYRAFGWDSPEFAHLPLILKPVGKGKLSKRDGDKLGFPVFPMMWTDPKTNDVSRGYKEDGYFPDALMNFLAFLGWNPGTEQELFNLTELIEAFDLKRVNKSGARFDPEKIKWYNQQYLQQKDNAELAELFINYIAADPVIANSIEKSDTSLSITYVTEVVRLIKERAAFVADFWSLGGYFFKAPENFEAKAAKKQWKEQTPEILTELIGVVENIEDFSSSNVETIVKAWIAEKELGFGQVMPPFRLSLVGEMKGPHVFDIAALLGKQETLSRIKYAIETL